MYGVGSIDGGGFKQALVDAHYARHEHDGGVAKPHEEVHKSDHAADADTDREEIEGVIDHAPAFQKGLDRADAGEKRVEQHRKRRRHDEVRHVDDRLEEALALDVEAIAGEEHRQQHGDHKLRQRACDPEDHRVQRVLQDQDRSIRVRRKQRFIIVEPDKVRAYLREADPIRLEKAVVDRQKLRNQGKNEVRKEERRYENVSPFCIADGLPLACSPLHRFHG